MRKELPVFYSFRFLCSLMVFLYHADVCGSVGGDFVTFFIVLSGFFAMYTYKASWGSTPISGPRHLLRKLKKFYPIHIVAFILAIPLYIGTLKKFDFMKQILITVCYNTYTQSFSPNPDYYFAYNGVEWTMSVLCFCYLMTPLIAKLLEKINLTSLAKFLLVFAGIYTIEFIYVLMFQNNELCVWICSVNPLFRILDYFIGCCLGKFYLYSEKYRCQNKTVSSIMQILTVILVFFTCVYLIPNVKTAYRWSLIMTPLSVITIYIFAFSFTDGLISKLLDNKLLIMLGKISYEIYILHLIVIRYLRLIGGFQGYAFVLVAFVLTLIASFIFHQFFSKHQKLLHGIKCLTTK